MYYVNNKKKLIKGIALARSGGVLQPPILKWGRFAPQ